MAAVQAFVADQSLKQIGIVDQRLAQPGAAGKHHHGIVNQKQMVLQQAQQIGRSRFGQPFKLIDRGIGIGRAGKQGRKRLLDSRGHELANAREISPGRFRIAKLHARGKNRGTRLSDVGHGRMRPS